MYTSIASMSVRGCIQSLSSLPCWLAFLIYMLGVASLGGVVVAPSFLSGTCSPGNTVYCKIDSTSASTSTSVGWYTYTIYTNYSSPAMVVCVYGLHCVVGATYPDYPNCSAVNDTYGWNCLNPSNSQRDGMCVKTCSNVAAVLVLSASVTILVSYLNAIIAGLLCERYVLDTEKQPLIVDRGVSL